MSYHLMIHEVNNKLFIFLVGGNKIQSYLVYSSLRAYQDNAPDWDNGFWVAEDYWTPGTDMYEIHREYFDNIDYYRKEIEKILIKEML